MNEMWVPAAVITESLSVGADAEAKAIQKESRERFKAKKGIRVSALLEHVAEHCASGPLDEESMRAMRAAVRYFREAAPNHIADEEQSLFPRLRRIDDAAIASLIQEADRLEAQHREAEPVNGRRSLRSRTVLT